jgi:hypothetical protein
VQVFREAAASIPVTASVSRKLQTSALPQWATVLLVLLGLCAIVGFCVYCNNRRSKLYSPFKSANAAPQGGTLPAARNVLKAGESGTDSGRRHGAKATFQVVPRPWEAEGPTKPNSQEAAILKAAAEPLERGSRHGSQHVGGSSHHSKNSHHSLHDSASGSNRHMYADAATQAAAQAQALERGLAQEWAQPQKKSQLPLRAHSAPAQEKGEVEEGMGGGSGSATPEVQSSGLQSGTAVPLSTIPEDAASRISRASFSTLLSIDGGASSMTSERPTGIPPPFPTQPYPPNSYSRTLTAVPGHPTPGLLPAASTAPSSYSAPVNAADPSGVISSSTTTFDEISIALSPQGQPPRDVYRAQQLTTHIDITKSGNVVISGSPSHPSMSSDYAGVLSRLRIDSEHAAA